MDSESDLSSDHESDAAPYKAPQRGSKSFSQKRGSAVAYDSDPDLAEPVRGESDRSDHSPVRRRTHFQPEPYDGEEEYVPDATDKVKQSTMLRLKKGFASRTVGTKLGRKAVAYFIGESGVGLLHHLKAAAKKDKGEKFAKSLKKISLKSAVKAKVLLDSGVMRLEQYGQLRQRSLKLLYVLSTVLGNPKNIRQRDLEEIEEMFSQFTVTVVTLYAPHFTRKNVDRLRDTLNYWGSRHFLSLLALTPEYRGEREGIVHSIESMFQDGKKIQTKQDATQKKQEATQKKQDGKQESKQTDDKKAAK